MKRITSDTGPCVIVPNWLWQSSVSDGALRLYMVLASHADNVTDECKLLRATIAMECHSHVKTIDRYVKELVAAEALTVITRRGAN